MLRASCLLVLLVVFQSRADFRTGVKVVRVDAEVSEAGRLIDGLTKDDFRVRDEGKVRDDAIAVRASVLAAATSSRRRSGES